MTHKEPEEIALQNQNESRNPPEVKRDLWGIKWLQSLLTEKKQPTFLGHITLSLGLLVFISISYFILAIYANCKSEEWFSSQVSTLSSAKSTQSTFNYQINDNQAQKSRLMTQLDQVEQNLQMHKKIVLYMYRQNYLSLSMALIVGSLSALCLVFISKNGWEKTNKALINIFVICSVGTLLYADIANIFKHEENIENNWLLYSQHEDLRNQILSYVVTKTDRKGQPIKIEEFIGNIDAQLNLLNQKPLIFDSKPLFERYLKQIEDKTQQNN